MRLGPVLPFGALLSLGSSAPHDITGTKVLPRASTVPFGTMITRCTTPGVVALTFDDGPSFHTPHILDLLDQYGAKATFFINGENWSRNIDDPSTPWPETLRRIVGSGHQLGSHSWSHKDMSSLDPGSRVQEIVKLDQTVAKVIGKSPTYFRPPFANCNAECLADMGRLGYHVVNFDVDTKDYENRTPQLIGISKDKFSTAVDAGQPNDSFLVLAHDVHVETAITLTPFMLEKIKQKGYRAVTVGECLGDAPENWYKTA